MMELKLVTRVCIDTDSGLDATDVSLEGKKSRFIKKLLMATDLKKAASPSAVGYLR